MDKLLLAGTAASVEACAQSCLERSACRSFGYSTPEVGRTVGVCNLFKDYVSNLHIVAANVAPAGQTLQSFFDLSRFSCSTSPASTTTTTASNTDSTSTTSSTASETTTSALNTCAGQSCSSSPRFPSGGCCDGTVCSGYNNGTLETFPLTTQHLGPMGSTDR